MPLTGVTKIVNHMAVPSPIRRKMTYRKKTIINKTKMENEMVSFIEKIQEKINYMFKKVESETIVKVTSFECINLIKKDPIMEEIRKSKYKSIKRFLDPMCLTILHDVAHMPTTYDRKRMLNNIRLTTTITTLESFELICNLAFFDDDD